LARSESSIRSAQEVVDHPERFDPRDGKDLLIGAEHFARYWWVAGLAAKSDVLDAGCGIGYGLEILAAAGAARSVGVDLDPAAVVVAQKQVAHLSATVEEGDLRDLPFADNSFDLAVCFETIEHMQQGEQALSELRRVLRPGGRLVISSPNPDVYQGGNEHHVREYRPAELAAMLREHFRNVKSYRQHAWLASAIEQGGGEDDESPHSWRVRRTADLVEDGESYSIAMASNEELPDVQNLVSLGSAFEVRWWQQQVEHHRHEAEKSLLQSSQRENDAALRLHEASGALLDVNQELAQLPALEHRAGSLSEENAELAERLHEYQEALQQLTNSTSWRLTAPLRALGAMVSRNRS